MASLCKNYSLSKKRCGTCFDIDVRWISYFKLCFVSNIQTYPSDTYSHENKIEIHKQFNYVGRCF